MADNKRLGVSFVTATLNAETYLMECLTSVAAQRGSPSCEVEHIVIDGGSEDETVEIARSGGCTVLEGRDAGMFDAMNKGIAASRGDVIGCLGADDKLHPGALEAVAKWYGSRRSLWAVGAMRWIDREGRPLARIGPPPLWMNSTMYASLGWNCCHHQSSFVCRELFDRLGGYDPTFRYAGDFDLFARALNKGYGFDRIDAVLADFRVHSSNMSLSGSQDLEEENERILEAHGPSSRVLASIYRQGLRVWLNGSNPRWFLRKKLPNLAFFSSFGGSRISDAAEAG